MSTTCALHKMDIRKEWNYLQIEPGYWGFNDEYVSEIYKYNYILDYAFHFFNW